MKVLADRGSNVGGSEVKTNVANKSGNDYRGIQVNTNNSACYNPDTLDGAAQSSAPLNKEYYELVKSLLSIGQSIAELEQKITASPPSTATEIKSEAEKVEVLSARFAQPSLQLILELLSQLGVGKSFMDDIAEVLQGLDLKDPKQIMAQINKVLLKKLAALQAELAKIPAKVDENLLKLISKYIEDLSEKINTLLILAITSADQGLKALERLISKLLDIVKEGALILGSDDLKKLEALLVVLQTFIQMLDNLMLVLLQQLVAQNKKADEDRNQAIDPNTILAALNNK